ncbi:hypothetical protein RGQ13_19140 [Thalassotalea psychrophila]|uniref:Uncharacterized protein n=1 Tax=Thalassotalea psychrophila TaxID=3065647 RepID=A0ABY9TWX0_9GAMM|nr:hypothetical protein RGQ13_19140 [Colwelliaceae bacterium SQ149]
MQLKQFFESNPNKFVSVIYFLAVVGQVVFIATILLSNIPEDLTIIENYKMLATPEYKHIYHRLFIVLLLYIVAFIGLLKIETTSKYRSILIGYLWLITVPSIMQLKFIAIVPALYATYVYYKYKNVGTQYS